MPSVLYCFLLFFFLTLSFQVSSPHPSPFDPLRSFNVTREFNMFGDIKPINEASFLFCRAVWRAMALPSRTAASCDWPDVSEDAHGGSGITKLRFVTMEFENRVPAFILDTFQSQTLKVFI